VKDGLKDKIHIVENKTRQAVFNFIVDNNLLVSILSIYVSIYRHLLLVAILLVNLFSENLFLTSQRLSETGEFMIMTNLIAYIKLFCFGVTP
jgi:hypothetical protein